jgi:hypothetical protein
MAMRTLALAPFVLLTACVSTPSVRPLRDYEIAIGPYHERGTQSVVGSLMYEGRCLLFDGEKGSVRLLPIWPRGTRFEESLVTFHRPAKSDQRVVVGEEIRLDGVPVQWADLDPRLYAPFRQQCGWAQPFFVSSLAPAN